MLGEDIEGVVHSQDVFQLGGEIAADGAHDAEDDGRPDGHVAGGGRDGDQSRNGAGAEPDRGPFLVNAIVQEDPGESTDRGRQMGDDAGRDGAQVGAEGRTAVEAEPADPEENGPDDDVGDVMRPIRKAMEVGVAASLAEHDRIRESGGPGRDMNRRSSGEIQPAHFVHPAGRVPRPAGNRIVNDGGPDQHEHHARQHPTAIGGGANRQGRSARTSTCIPSIFFTGRIRRDSRDGGEHALVDGEEEIGDFGASHGRRAQDVSESNVIEVADVLASRVGKGQGIAPEKPLETDQSGRHQR